VADLPSNERLTKLITEVLGERCPEHHDGCMTCAAWWMFDQLPTAKPDDALCPHGNRITGLVGERPARCGCSPVETPAPHPDVLAMLKEANELCRSAHAVAERIATQYGTVCAGVNFGALHERLNRSLIAQHAVLTKHGAFTVKTGCSES
jgi:hypothetical protein